jgi:transcriptional regulator with XRE-family HTH domain
MQELERVIGRVVAAKRNRLGLSQEGLAEAAGLHPTYISLIERGLRCPSARVVLALASGLGTKASALMAAVERELAKPVAPAAKKPSAKKRPASRNR